MLQRTFRLTIGGELRDTVKYFDVLNPATGKVIAKCPEATKQDLDDAVAVAQSAFASWSKTSVETRRKVLLKIAEALKTNSKDLANVLVLEQGKPFKQAMGEIMGAAYWAVSVSKAPLPADEVLQETEKVIRKVTYHPLGVVAGITPWNFPVSLAAWKILPALLTGNTFVLKPSPHTPLTSLMLGEILRDVVPAGVVNVLSGGNELGVWMTEHPGFAKVSFTGSVPTGKAIQKSCADDLKRVTLELGGNDAALVLEDAPVDKVAKRVFMGAFANSGQVCSAIKRVYVPESIHDKFVATISKIAESVKFGDGSQPDVLFGPVNNAQQLGIVENLVQDARERGATVNTGGKKVGATEGYLYAPTIISNVDDSFRIVQEEQFGPVLPILKYKSVDDAVHRINNTNFGLGASVWGKDAEHAASVAENLDAGTVWVNQHLVLLPDQPFGGRKWSGIGRENGKWGIMSYLEPKSINVAKL